ncbi:hypothetical protein KL938_002508 [Ogataea parapolymorpha]|nr:hypothetical protein KL938_002508 [Ogataea parapolymorpha]
MTTQLLDVLHELKVGPKDNNVWLDPTTKTATPPPPVSEEGVLADIKRTYLSPTNELPWDLLDKFQQVPEVGTQDRERFYRSMLTIPPTLKRTTVRFQRSGIEGSIVSYKETFDRTILESGNSAVTSLSVKRKFGGKDDAIKGNSGFLPFQPGGLTANEEPKDSTKFLHRDENGLLDIPQGLSRGLTLKDGTHTDLTELEQKQVSDEQETVQDQEPEIIQEADVEDEISKFIPASMLTRPSKRKPALPPKREWAHVVDVNHAIPNFDELVPNPARTWPFELDTFQKEAVYHLEKNDSVFVAAHTSAGKTVVAEYAIALANRNMTKTIYTSPIKALSNQKFRDFKESFDDVDVGVITGDVQINPEANCLIMTTEILRSMLYRGADLIRDVEFVIFDEVHYVNDIERGVVWEEVIIMLPEHIKVVLLSATVPNTYEFASWVGRTRQKDIYVISTSKRPVPLEIFVWAKDDIFKLIDANGSFQQKNFRLHEDKLLKKKDVPESNAKGKGGAVVRGGARGGARGGRGGARGGSTTSGKMFKRDGPNKNSWHNLVTFLQKKDLMPAVIFVFSKKRCEEYADTLRGVNFCTAKEASQIHMFIDKAVSRLKKEDRELPQILKVREMLSRGIAVHHGGLLPIVKEIIEILFSKTLIKVLFATETFAMGLNLPTRTVVFSELRKHDGTGYRNLLPGEFTQMSGRAGRRGLDCTGTVIVMAYNQPLEEFAFKEVTMGTATKLSSKFRLTYNMILNLLRIEALRVEEMIKRSFGENTTQSLLPEHEIEIAKLEKQLRDLKKQNISEEDNAKLNLFYNTMEEMKEQYGDLVQESMKLLYYQKRLKVGRLVVYRDRDTNQSYPAVTARWSNGDDKITLLTLDVQQSSKNQFNCVYTTNFGQPYVAKFFSKWKAGTNFKFIDVPLNDIEFVGAYSVRSYINGIINKDPKSISDFKTEVGQLLRYQRKWGELDWTAFQNPNMIEILTRIDELRDTVMNCFADEKFDSLVEAEYPTFMNRKNIEKRIESLKSLMSEENLELLPDYEQRLEVLKQLEFVNDQLTVTLKGRVACEINFGFELIVTELVFENILGTFTSEEIVALLSCFVYDGKRGNDEGPAPLCTPRLESGKDKIVEIVEQVMKVSNENKIILTAEEEQFLENNRFGLVNVVYEWARGQSFKDIMELSNDENEAEGTIVRVITRLDEVCRVVMNCALIVGDSELHMKMGEAQEKIKRDIVFCASLYL